YLLTVQVTDNGSSQLSDIATITINVTQANEPPVANNRQFKITEDSDMGFVVGSVPASDPNMGQQLAFAITAGDPDGRFAIDPNTGQITVALNGALSAQNTPQFVLTIEVTDNGSPALSATATV